MAPLDASQVAALLVELGRRTALAGDNYFRAKAYQRAADTLSALVEPLDRVIAENRLRQLPGSAMTAGARSVATRLSLVSKLAIRFFLPITDSKSSGTTTRTHFTPFLVVMNPILATRM
jgi:hypothetical protein